MFAWNCSFSCFTMNDNNGRKGKKFWLKEKERPFWPHLKTDNKKEYTEGIINIINNLQ